MFQNYLTVALRKLQKQRDYALLNVLGLGLSVACGVLIFALIRHHNSFDTYHKNAARTARVLMDVRTEGIMPFPGTPMPMAKTLRAECPLLEKVAAREAHGLALISVANPSGTRDKYKEEGLFAWAEPEYFEILDMPLLRGDLGAMKEPGTVLLSERLCKKYFGPAADPLGRSIRYENEVELRVVGVLRDLPKNTDYKQEILGSWATKKTMPGEAKSLDSWSGARGDNYCFALLRPGATVAELDAFLVGMRSRYPHPDVPDLFQHKAKPLLGLHFDTDYGFGMNRKYLLALGFIGLFLLGTACVNFVNMATAQAMTRTREVGVRKAMGGTRRQIFWQFMSETGLIVAASLGVGLLLARLAMPYLNAWTDTKIAFDLPLLTALAGFMVVLGIGLTFLAGFYPGWMQARFEPVTSLKGMTDGKSAGGGFGLRRVLVTTQFAISQILIIGAAVVIAQTRFARDADWGFRPGAVVLLEVPEAKRANSLRQQIAQISGVKSASLCSQPPASNSNSQTGLIFDNRPEPEQWIVNNKPADAHYLETFGLQLVAGRNLQSSDTVREFLVNETFLKKLNLASPEDILNKTVRLEDKVRPIVGVIKDFHNLAISEPIQPIIVSCFSPDFSQCAVQLAPGNPVPVLAQVRQIWEANFPDHYYEHTFMDEQLGEFLETETMILRLVGTFAGIAIFIGCLGLYGLAAFMAARRRKEMGVRKVLGAGVPGILWLFGREYVRLIVIAFALAAPLAWWVMNAWLADYAYRVSFGPGVFAVALLGTFGVAALTVGWQSLRAALRNPVESLRSE